VTLDPDALPELIECSPEHEDLLRGMVEFFEARDVTINEALDTTLNFIARTHASSALGDEQRLSIEWKVEQLRTALAWQRAYGKNPA